MTGPIDRGHAALREPLAVTNGGELGDQTIADCRRFESDNNCSLTIIGEEDEVITAAAQHAVTAHGHHDTPELREQLRGMLEPEASYQPGTRQATPLPS